MERERFEELVFEAIEGLPLEFKQKLENIAVVVQDWPTPEQMAKVKVKYPQDLLGLYEGVPLLKRGRGYSMVLPDKITIFQKPIEIHYRTEERIIKKVREVVRHEIAHYFGITDQRLKELGRY